MTLRHEGVPGWAQTGNTVYIVDNNYGTTSVVKAEVVRHTKTQSTVQYERRFHRQGAEETELVKRRFKVDDWVRDQFSEIGSGDGWHPSPSLYSEGNGVALIARLEEKQRLRKITDNAVQAAAKVAGTPRRQNPRIEDMQAAIDAMQVAIRELHNG